MDKVCIEAFRTGRFSTETLDNVVLRILTEKYRMGLFDHPYAMEGEELKESFVKVHQEGKLSYDSAVESMVLLKNDGILPFSAEQMRNKKIAVIGPHADNARMFLEDILIYP